MVEMRSLDDTHHLQRRLISYLRQFGSSEGGILIDVRHFERVIWYLVNLRLLEDIYNFKTQNGGLLFCYFA